MINLSTTNSPVYTPPKTSFLRSFLSLFLLERPTKRKGVNCIIRLGLPGSGKTLDQTEQDVLPHLLSGEEVWCSYWLNWSLPNYHYFTEFEEVEHLRNAVVVFDEIGQILPARAWENEGLRVQLFFQLHRHRHIDIIANTQDVSLVSKTVGIVANSWIFCQNVNSWFWDFVRTIFFFRHKVDILKSDVSYQGLKKMANGWELEQVLETDEQARRKSYSIESLTHEELNPYKIEVVHKYCSLCAMRQGSQILSGDTLRVCDYNEKKKTYTLKVPEFCQKHKNTLLTIRLSGLYDTDYEPPIIDKPVKFVPMIPSPAGYTSIKYSGRLSEAQLEAKKALSSK